uniref:Uncharacterized protein n=1 Tax=Panagrellus redivivus TaxID=6233 RepID=A0A7E4V668_PANRE
MAQPQLTVETVPTPSNPTTVPPDAQAESESCQNDYQTFKDYIETYSHILFHNFNRTIPLPDEDQPKTFTEYVDEAKLILTEHILEEKRKQLTEENPLSIRKPKFKPSAEVWFQRWRSTWLYLLKKKIQHKKALAELEFLKLAIPILEEAITICNDAKQFLTDELVLKNPDAYAQFLRQCGH